MLLLACEGFVGRKAKPKFADVLHILGLKEIQKPLSLSIRDRLIKTYKMLYFGIRLVLSFVQIC